jgi:hypothetical protein
LAQQKPAVMIFKLLLEKAWKEKVKLEMGKSAAKIDENTFSL